MFRVFELPLHVCLSCGLGSWRCILMSLKSNLAGRLKKTFAQDLEKKPLPWSVRLCAVDTCLTGSSILQIIIHYHPLSSIITTRKLIILYHNYHDNQIVSLSSIIIHYHPLSSIIIHYHPLSSIIIHYHPLSLILSSIIINIIIHYH